MATVRWIANAVTRAQVNTLTVSGTPAAGNTAAVTINGKTITYTVVTGDTIETIASELAALLRASEDGEFQLIVWTVDDAVITATAATAGVPFTTTGSGTLSVSSTGGGATTLTAASVQTNSSPNDAANTANWSGGSLPVNSDDVIIENTSQPLWWNLSTAISGVTLTSLKIRDSFAPSEQSWIGLPINHPTLGFREFRGSELTLTGATTLEINLANGAPAGAIQINGGSAASTIKITGSGSGAIGDEAVYWRGTHASSNAIEVFGGSLLIAPLLYSSTGTAVCETIKIISGAVRLSSGVTVNVSADLTDSLLDSRVTIPTFAMNGSSEATFRDAAACGTAMSIDEGVVFWNSSGNISGTLSIGSDGVIDFSGSKATITVGSGAGTVVLAEGSSYIDRQKRTIASWAATTVLLDRTSLAKVNIDLGDNLYIDAAVGP